MKLYALYLLYTVQLFFRPIGNFVYYLSFQRKINNFKSVHSTRIIASQRLTLNCCSIAYKSVVNDYEQLSAACSALHIENEMLSCGKLQMLSVLT